MLFNSVEFFAFLPIVFVGYWLLRRHLFFQNTFVLAASYIFYGWWDYRFLALIVLSSLTDFIIGQKIFEASSQLRKKQFLFLSLVINLGILAYFKYFNFFIDSFGALLESFGMRPNEYSLRVILPVGISFYTFQTLSYSIDIYRDRMRPTRNLIAFFAFVGFFPQLVAGPIERAVHLLPQFEKRREFDYDAATDGLRQILWGLFKKVVVADQCAVNVDYIFSNYSTLPASVLFLGAVLFAFQIYGDFSGYSDIARGTAKLFGISIMQNFSYPYLSRNIREFWRRWHISLSTFFRDYVYIPLGGSKKGRMCQIYSALIAFTISGLWHGANWTFIVWGFVHGLAYVVSLGLGWQLVSKTVVASGRRLPSLRDIVRIVSVFCVVDAAWIIFRAPSLEIAYTYLGRIFSFSILSDPFSVMQNAALQYQCKFSLLGVAVVVIVEWLQRERTHVLEIGRLPMVLRWTIYYLLVFFILRFMGEDKQFIYFQF